MVALHHVVAWPQEVLARAVPRQVRTVVKLERRYQNLVRRDQAVEHSFRPSFVQVWSVGLRL